MRARQLSTKIATGLYAAMFALPSVAFAEVNLKDLSLGIATGKGTTSVGDIFRGIIRILLLVVGAIAVIYLILSGFRYITAGGDDEKATAARKGVVNAIIGIIIVVATFFIINTAFKVSETVSNTGNVSGIL